MRALVLDSGWQPVSLFPIHAISWQAAVNRVINEMCDVVADYDELIKTPNLVMRKPAVIVRKTHDKPLNRRNNLSPTPSREIVYYRDGCSCQYCDTPLAVGDSTLDHVVPLSMGGSNTYDNVVISCGPCNFEKSNRVWVPRTGAWEPTYWDMVKIRRQFPITVDHESWADFIQPWEGEINVHRGSSFSL